MLSLGAVARCVEDLEALDGILGGHRRRRAVTQTTVHTRIEITPPSRDAGDRFASVTANQPAPALGGLRTERRLVRSMAGAERILLPVEMIHQVRGAAAQHLQSRARCRGNPVGPEMGDQAWLVVQSQEDVVVGTAAAPITRAGGCD
jgi:hypothetical protein